MTVGSLDEDLVVVGFVALQTRVPARLGSDEAEVAHEHEHGSVDDRHFEAVLRLDDVIDRAQTSVEVRADQFAVVRAQ